jgi:PAS domain S-box-containing protein
MVITKSVATDELESRLKGRIAELEKANKELHAELLDRTRVEEAVRKSEEQYRMLLNSIDEGFFLIEMVFDGYGKPLDYQILDANQSQEKVTELRDITGKKVRKLVTDIEDNWIKSLCNVALTGDSVRFKYLVEGAGRWFDVCAVRIGDGYSRKVAVLFKDITERKQAEEALREAYENLQVQSEELKTQSEELQMQNEELQAQTDELEEAYGILSESEKRFELLGNANALLLPSKEPEAIIQTIAEKVMRHLNCDVFFNYVFDEVQGRLHLNACGGISAEAAREIEWLDKGAAICGCVASDGCRIVPEDVQHNGDKQADLVRSMGIQAYACHPLLVGEKTIGTFSFGTKSRKDFKKDELAFMSTVADQVSVAIERKRTEESLRDAYENLQVQSEELHVANEELQTQSEELQAQTEELQGAYEALSVSEEHYRMLFTNMTESFALTEIIYDEDGKPCDYRYLEINPVYELNLGVKKEDLLGKNMLEVFPKTTPITIEKFRKVAISGKSAQFEVFSLEENKYIDVFAFMPEKGKLAFIYRDVTERKKAEEMLERSNQRINDILNSIQDDFYVLDRDWNFVYASKKFTSKIGKEPKDFVGKNIWKMFPKYIGTDYEDNFRAVMDKREIRRFEVVGKYTNAYYSMAIFPSAEGITVLGTDITEQKKIEETLRESEARRKVAEAVQTERERLNSVLDMLPAYVVLLSQDYHVPFANRFFEERFGRSDGRRCYEYLFHCTEPCENCETYKAFKTGAPHHWEWTGPDNRNYDVYDYPFIDSDGSALIMEVGIDITEIKKAQAAVLTERKRLFDVLETLPAMICLRTSDHHVAFANRSFREKFGEAEGRHCYEYCHGLTGPCEFCESYKVLETGQPHHWEINNPDGSVSDAYDFPFTDVDGSPMILEMDIDITERKRNETELRKYREHPEELVREQTVELAESEKRFRTLSENSPDVIARFDRQNRHLYVNPAVRIPYGRSPEEIIGKTHSELGMDSGMVMFWEAHHEKVFATGKPETMEFEYTSPQGKKYYFNTRIVPEFVDGEVASILAISRDIMDIKEAEIRLKETLDNLEELVEERTAQLENAYGSLKESEKGLAEAQKIAHLGNWNWNIVTDELYWSDEIYRIFGYSPQEFGATSDAFYSYVHPEDRNYVNDVIKGALEGKPYNIDHRIVLASGEEKIVHEQGEVIFGNGNVPVRMTGIVQDITDRKKVEKALELANAYNRSLIEASLDPLVTIGPDGKITDVNKATELVTGYFRSELIGTDFSDYFTEPQRAREGYQQVFREGSVFDYALEIRHRSRKIIPVLYNASVYKNESGEIIGVFAAARDVTEIKKAEKELQFASKYNRSLIETSLDPLVTIGPDGRITDVNKATESVTGYSRKELIGTDFSNYFTEPEKAKEGYKQVFRKGLVLDYALEIQRREGHITPVLYNASVYRNEDGEVIGIFAAARDITERKKAEEKIQILANVVESSNDAIITESLDGIITSWNKGAEQVYGYLAEEVLGRNISILEPDNTEGETKHLIEKIKKGEKVQHYETLRLKKDGTIISVSITLSPVFNVSGKLVAISSTAGDITEKKIAENLLCEKQVAEVANRTKNEFLANMSHELRTPLNSIIGFSDMLYEQAYGELNKRQLRAVGNISNSGKHLLNLINGILDLSKIEANKMELDYREFELAAKLGLIRNILHPIADKKNIKIEIDIDRELTRIRADEDKFTRIMYNLVDNAIKFSYENSFVKIGARRKGDFVEITVKDTGIGIKAEDQHKLFKPFSQVNSSSSRKFQGTGLGLSLVKQIVNLHGGYVWFRSNQGEGSTFAFAIPIATNMKVLAYCH